MPLSQVDIINFLQYLQFQKRQSSHTIIAYRTDLHYFYEFLEAYGFDSPAQIKSSIIRTWLVDLKEKGMTAKTINRKISTLKSYFRYLLKAGVIETSPMVTITSPRIGKRLPEYVEDDQLQFLLQETNFGNEETEERERLILEILYYTGLRKSELINLKIDQIDFSNRQLKVLGKGSKERIIPINIYLCERIRNYITLQGGSEFLFNKKGKKLDPKYVYNLVKKHLALVTSKQKKSPHILRHSFATHLSNNGAELNAIKELLGHSSLAATQVYTHNNIEQLKIAYKKAHPKA